MTLLELKQQLATFIKESPKNYMKSSCTQGPENVGTQIYDEPLIGCAAANDPLFEYLKQEEHIYGSTFRLPEEWLPGAVSVISFFLPYTKEVCDSNRRNLGVPSETWLYSHIEGRSFPDKAAKFLAEQIQKSGEKAIIPSSDPSFLVIRDPSRAEKGLPPYVSNWSESHIAFIAGLGTFGLSKNLITEKGVCGRFCSIITNLPLEVTPRGYTYPYEYCIFCGACVKRCTANAIGELEKDNRICADYVTKCNEIYKSRFACGNCQISVPCENRRPIKRK